MKEQIVALQNESIKLEFFHQKAQELLEQAQSFAGALTNIHNEINKISSFFDASDADYAQLKQTLTTLAEQYQSIGSKSCTQYTLLSYRIEDYITKKKQLIEDEITSIKIMLQKLEAIKARRQKLGIE